QADIAGLSAWIIDDPNGKLEAAGLQVLLPVVEDLPHAARQGRQPFRLVLAPGGFFFTWPIDRRQTVIDDRASPVAAEVAGEGSKHQLGFAALEGALDAIQARMDPFVRQVKIVQTLPELRKFLFLAALEHFRGLLVAATARISLRKEGGDG